jgi:hypothetical protein
VIDNIPPLGRITATDQTAAHAPTTQGAPPHPHSSGDLPFAMGQHLFGRVIQVISDHAALIDLAGQHLMTSTPVALAEGQVLNIVVRGLGAVVDLELVDPPSAFSDQAYALATLREARQLLPSSRQTALDDVRAVLQILQQLPGVANLHARASAALLPLPLGADGDRLIEGLRRAIVGNGMFFEARLATTAERGGAAPEGPRLEDDVRTLLAELSRAAVQAPALDEATKRLAADVLARQVDVAWHKLRDGELRLDVPVMIGSSPTDVHMRVRDEKPRSEDEPAADGRVMELALELPELGRVRASIRWTPGHLTTRFAVEGAAQEQTLEEGLEALTSRLQAVGFRHVALSVDVDPDGVTLPADEPERPDGPAPLPGGSIFRVRV